MRRLRHCQRPAQFAAWRQKLCLRREPVISQTMRISSFWRTAFLILTVILCAVPPVISETTAALVPIDGRQFSYRAFLRGVRKGVPAASFIFESLSSSNQFTLGPGTLSFVGRILPPPPLAAAFFPTRMRLSLVVQTETGKIISRETFDLSVQSDGRILHQTFPFPNVVIHSKEKLLSSLTPFDAALPACILSITARLAPLSAITSTSTDSNPPFPRPGILGVAFSVSREQLQLRQKVERPFTSKWPLLKGRAFPGRPVSFRSSAILLPPRPVPLSRAK